MKFATDFDLAVRFGVVERIIFRLVLNGFCDAEEMSSALPLFSTEVVADGVRRLVNDQLLQADMSTHALRLSEPVEAIAIACSERSIDLELAHAGKDEALPQRSETSAVTVISGASPEAKRVKRAILRELLPELDLGQYATALDFALRQHE